LNPPRFLVSLKIPIIATSAMNPIITIPYNILMSILTLLGEF
jgi:hypothetical protein